MGNIYTIGYEGASISEFIDTLRDNGVNILLDVREYAVSRKKGFSKNMLRENLENAGISYRHEKSLGSPKPVRNELYASKDYQRFFNDYDEYLNSQMELLHSLSEEITGDVALMCFEKDVMTCHRKSVARELKRITGSDVKHLIATRQQKGELAHGRTSTKKNLHSCQSISAT